VSVRPIAYRIKSENIITYICDETNLVIIFIEGLVDQFFEID